MAIIQLVKIPSHRDPMINDIIVNENAEALVDVLDLVKNRVIYEPVYFERSLPGAQRICYLRETALKKLTYALDALPNRYGLKVFDAWRPIRVQQYLFTEYCQHLRQNEKYKDVSDNELIEIAKRFVSVPTMNNPYAHGTGGAVDLTLINDNGEELDMGGGFDDFAGYSATDYYESHTPRIIRQNRRLLYTIMTNAGFTNLPSEWWHYDYGNPFWAYYNATDAIYGNVTPESQI